MTTGAGPIHRILGYLTVTDPGFRRLRTALTTVSALAAALAILTAGGHPARHTMPAILLGAYVAIQASATVKDATQRDRVVTTAFLIVPALAAVTLGTLLQPFGRTADVAFVGVLFFAVWIRRWGPRGNACGMVLYIAYFYTLVLHSTVAELPLLFAGVGTGVAVTLLVRVFVFPERSRREIFSLVTAFRSSSRSALEIASRPAPQRGRALERAFARIGTTVMLIEDWTDRHDGQPLLGMSNAVLTRLVFHAQSETEAALDAVAVLPVADRKSDRIEKATAMLAEALRRDRSRAEQPPADRPATAAAEGAGSGSRAEDTALLVEGAARAHDRLARAMAERIGRGEVSREHRPHAVVPDRVGSGLSSSTRSAVQVAAAAGVAAVLGDLVSPERWYWAVLTAFLVYTGTSSRGAVLVRAGERVLGTVCGVVAGTLVVGVVGQHVGGQIALVMASVFFAFYLVAVNYILQTFFMTVMLAGLYELLGEYSVSVLVVRVEETAVGAVVGIAAAYTVLATSSRTPLVAAVDQYLQKLSALIGQCSAQVGAAADPDDLIASARSLDTALTAVETAASTLLEDPVTRGRGSVSWLVRRLREINRAVHALVRAGTDDEARDRSPGAEIAPPRVGEGTVRRVRDDIELVRQRNLGGRAAPVSSPGNGIGGSEGPAPVDADGTPTFSAALNRIDRLLVDLSR